MEGNVAKLFAACKISFRALLSPSMNTAQVIEHFGTRSAAATALKITTQTIRDWEARKMGIPWHRQIMIEHLTGGKLKAARIHKANGK